MRMDRPLGLAKPVIKRYVDTVALLVQAVNAVPNTVFLVSVIVMTGGTIQATTTRTLVIWKDTRFNMHTNNNCPICKGLWSPFPCPYEKDAKLVVINEKWDVEITDSEVTYTGKAVIKWEQ